MAIILNNSKTRASINPSGFNPAQGLCRETTIVINNDGSVSTNGILNLGFQGDKNVTVINIDTSNLNWGNLSEQSANLKDAYQPILIFKNLEDNTTTSIEFEGNYFSVPYNITQKATSYDIIYTLQERISTEEINTNYKGNVGDDSSSTFREIFISQVFKGVVHPSVESSTAAIDNWEDISNTSSLLLSSQYEALHKPEVYITWNGKTGFSISSNNIGNQFDSLVTPLCFEELPIDAFVNSTDEIEICFWNNTKAYKATFNTINKPLKIWTPKEITSQAQTWNVGLILTLNSSSQKLASNIFNFVVQGNFLSSDDLDEDIEQDITQPIYDENGNTLSLVDEDGNEITTIIETVEPTGQSYTLGFSGSEVNSLLGWVNLKQESVNDHLLNTDIHITQTERTKWNGYDTRIQRVESFVDNYSEEGLASEIEDIKTTIGENTQKININTNQINILSGELDALKNKESQDINLLDIKIDSVDRKVVTVQANDAQQDEKINDLTTKVNIHTDALASMEGYGNQLANEIATRAEQDALIRQSINTLESTLINTDNDLKEAIQNLQQEKQELSQNFEEYKNTNNSVNDTQNSQLDNLSSGLSTLQQDLNQFKTEPILKTNNIQSVTLLETEEEYLNLVNTGGVVMTRVYFIKEEE